MKDLTPSEEFFQQADVKFNIGDPIDDMELGALIDFYTKMVRNLELLGRDFILIVKECRRRLQTLEDFKAARRRR